MPRICLIYRVCAGFLGFHRHFSFQIFAVFCIKKFGNVRKSSVRFRFRENGCGEDRRAFVRILHCVVFQFPSANGRRQTLSPWGSNAPKLSACAVGCFLKTPSGYLPRLNTARSLCRRTEKSYSVATASATTI